MQTGGDPENKGSLKPSGSPENVVGISEKCQYICHLARLQLPEMGISVRVARKCRVWFRYRLTNSEI